MIEFTGERVIPGAVNDDLWAEHFGRYALAARYAGTGCILDIGCGTGYGAAALGTRGGMVVGVDPAVDAVAYASAHYSFPNLTFLQAAAERLPFRDRSFHLITAFEVIEHLADWRMLLRESRRVLRPDGLFLVSTPNKLYYTESRAREGPNPFHTHEFEYAEFQAALAEFFPRVTTLLQNRLESFSFSPAGHLGHPPDARIDGEPGSPGDAHFFLALCTIDTAIDPRSFLYVPQASNLLREREHHISLLEQELIQSKAWLDGVIADHKKLFEAHAEQTRHLEDQNRWAGQLEQDWRTAQTRIVQLQEEFKVEQTAGVEMAGAYESVVSQLRQQNIEKTEWALETERRLTGELAAKCAELAETVRLLDSAEATVVERTHWAQELQQQLQNARNQLRVIAESRWVRMGRAIGIGPRVQD